MNAVPHLLRYGVHTHIATDRVVQRGQTHEHCPIEVAVCGYSHWIVPPAACRHGQAVTSAVLVAQWSSAPQASHLGGMNMNFFCSST